MKVRKAMMKNLEKYSGRTGINLETLLWES
jgi:hypothetical protein